MTMPEVLTPRCPLCDEPPMMVFGGGTQAFCGNDDCTLICWDPSKTLDDNLLNAGVVRFPWDEPRPEPPQAAQ
jgi:hypothetical protein